MRPCPIRSRPPLRASLAALVLALVSGACADTPSPPPATEFLVAAGDSTYWVRPVRNGLRLRSSPILLARFDDRFHEVYVTDDDRSYDDAIFVGQRVWRRDILRGDSVLVFEDTLIPRLARQWAADHPDARLLGPNEAPPEEVSASASAEVTVIAVHGRFMSYEYHADVEGEVDRPWHTTRRGVVDLRSGRTVTLAELFDPAAAGAAVAVARRSFRGVVDSLLASGNARAARLASTLGAFTFDSSSFSLTGDAESPAVAFHVPSRGEGAAGEVAIPLPPVPVPAPAWWTDIRGGLPAPDGDAPTERWEHGAYALTARYGGGTAVLSLRDTADGRWTIGRVQAPVHQIHWLDSPTVDSVTRRGLTRAFDEAVFYDETVRTASYLPRGGAAHASCALPPRRAAPPRA